MNLIVLCPQPRKLSIVVVGVVVTDRILLFVYCSALLFLDYPGRFVHFLYHLHLLSHLPIPIYLRD